MVDIVEKTVSIRTAVARGKVVVQHTTLDAIERGEGPKGNVFNTARIAGINAAKKTAHLIPLCHPLCCSYVAIDFSLNRNSTPACVIIEASVKVEAKTGVEMEALTAVSVAALTIYDMCKAVDNSMSITEIRLCEKQKEPLKQLRSE